MIVDIINKIIDALDKTEDGRDIANYLATTRVLKLEPERLWASDALLDEVYRFKLLIIDVQMSRNIKSIGSEIAEYALATYACKFSKSTSIRVDEAFDLDLNCELEALAFMVCIMIQPPIEKE